MFARASAALVLALPLLATANIGVNQCNGGGSLYCCASTQSVNYLSNELERMY